MEKLIIFADDLLQKPQSLLNYDINYQLETLNVLKEFCQQDDQDIIIDDMEEVQIWAQLEGQLQISQSIMEKITSKIQLTTSEIQESQPTEQSQQTEQENTLEPEYISEEEIQPQHKQKTQRPQQTDSLQSMDEFLDQADEEDIYFQDHQKFNENSIESFEEESQIENSEANQANSQENEGSDEEQYSMDEEIEGDIFNEHRENELSQPIIQEDKQQNQIDILENRLLNNEKLWQERGELFGTDRPLNSLVNENLQFNRTTQIKDETIEEQQNRIENIIKQRIIDEQYDDRVQFSFQQQQKDKELISKEKSKQGLGEMFEDEFKVKIGVKDTKEDKFKNQLQDDFQELMYQLNKISSSKFVAKPMNNLVSIKTTELDAQSENKVNVMVEKTVSQSFKEKKHAFVSREEMSKEEKNTARNSKKKLFRTRLKEKQKKKNIQLLQFKGETKFEYNKAKQAKAKGEQLAKEKNTKSVKFTKSSQFFDNLQNNKEKQPVKQVKQQNFKL